MITITTLELYTYTLLYKNIIFNELLKPSKDKKIYKSNITDVKKSGTLGSRKIRASFLKMKTKIKIKVIGIWIFLDHGSLVVV